eukprot:2888336-Rhodomonas_salina.1
MECRWQVHATKEAVCGMKAGVHGLRANARCARNATRSPWNASVQTEAVHETALRNKKEKRVPGCPAAHPVAAYARSAPDIA